MTPQSDTQAFRVIVWDGAHLRPGLATVRIAGRVVEVRRLVVCKGFPVRKGVE